MKKYLQVFVGAILAGILIAIGATVYLATLPYGKVIAAVLFGFGLFTIIQLELYLYTGKVGFVLENNPRYLADLPIGLLGNFLGVVLFCLIIKFTRSGENLVAQAKILVEAKQNDTFYSILLLSFGCGVMVYLAVKGHKSAQYDIAKVLMCFGAVTIFILSGFEHCIANAAYYTYAGVFNLKALGYFALMVLGNSLGAIAMDGLLKLLYLLKKPETTIVEE